MPGRSLSVSRCHFHDLIHGQRASMWWERNTTKTSPRVSSISSPGDTMAHPNQEFHLFPRAAAGTRDKEMLEPPLSSSPSQTRARPKELGFAPFVLLTSPCLVALSRRRNCPVCAFPLSTFSLLLQGTLRRFPNHCKVSPALEGAQKSEIVPHILHLSGEDFGNLFAAMLSLNCAASHSFRKKCLTTTEQT